MERDHGHIDQGLSFAGHSWRPRQRRSSSSSLTSYFCGYCNREFRSPQGLGGHMNVHRWDRARLIHGQCSVHRLPSPANNPISPSGKVIDPSLSLEQMPHCTGKDGSAAVVAEPVDVCRFTASAPSNTTKDFEVKNFESAVGTCGHQDSTEDRLDLELRLGCS